MKDMMMRSNYQDDYDMADFFKSMGSSDNYRTGSYRKNDPMSQFKQMFNSYRSKRQVAYQVDNLDLGDRLVEKLAEQKHQMEAKIGNLTCVLRETNGIDASNNLDLQAMKRDAQQYTMPSPWFGQKYEQMLDSCYRWPPTYQLKLLTTLSCLEALALSSWESSRCLRSAR